MIGLGQPLLFQFFMVFCIQRNFTKFLVGKDGTVAARFESAVTPDSAEVAAAIEKALQ